MNFFGRCPYLFLNLLQKLILKSYMKQIFTAGIILAATATAAADVWTYDNCVDYARAHNITLQKTRLAETTADADLDEAKAQWQPSLDFATTQGLSNSPWTEGDKNTYSSSYGLNASWTVWNGGQRENTIRRNRLQSQISRLNTDDALRTLETDLLQVYLNLLYARESIGIYEDALRLSTAQANRTQQLMEAGRASSVDYAQMRSQQEQDNYALVNARGTYDTRRMELKKLLELSIEADIEPADVEWTAEQVLAALPPIDESYSLALSTDLQLRSLELADESAGLDIAIARSGALPRIALTAGVGTGYNAPGGAFGTSLKRNISESVGLTVSVPIFDNRKTKSAVIRAEVQQLNAQLDIDQRNTDLAQLVENWYIDTRSAQSRYTAAEQQLESAQLSEKLTSEQFDLGLVNTVELLTANNDLTNARHSLLQAKYMAMLGQKMIQYYRTAKISLQ